MAEIENSLADKIMNIGQHCALCYNLKIAPAELYRKNYDNKSRKVNSGKYKYVIFCKYALLPNRVYLLRDKNSILQRFLNKKCPQYYAKPAETLEDLEKIKRLVRGALEAYT